MEPPSLPTPTWNLVPQSTRRLSNQDRLGPVWVRKDGETLGEIKGARAGACLLICQNRESEEGR